MSKPKEKIPGTYDVAMRLVRAEEAFLETLMKFGDITREQAEQVLKVYRKLRCVRRAGADSIVVTHGAFLDRDVIRRAMEEKV